MGATENRRFRDLVKAGDVIGSAISFFPACSLRRQETGKPGCEYPFGYQ
jgi:hypothetical protein